MKECITCLPITLPSEVRPGLALTPFVVSVLAKLTGHTSVCCINMKGLRYRNLAKGTVEQRLVQFRSLLQRLELDIDAYWFDNDPGHAARLQGYCEQLAAHGELRRQTENVLICRCGAAEILQSAIDVEWMMDRKVVRFQEGQMSCKLCATSLQNVRKPCLLLESRFAQSVSAVFPSFYNEEIEELRHKSQQPLLISRERREGYRVRIFERTWWLDIDFCWSLLFCSLLEDGFQPVAVVVSSRSLKPLLWAVGISGKLSERLANLQVIVTPFASFTGSDAVRHQPRSLQQLIDRYGRTPVRLLLADALKWKQKEVKVSSSVIFWALKGLASAPRPHLEERQLAVSSITETIRLMDGNLIETVISDLRKKNEVRLSPYHSLLVGRQ